MINANELSSIISSLVIQFSNHQHANEPSIPNVVNEQNQSNSNLRQEQDDAYNEALELDRIREQSIREAREEEERRILQEKKQIEEEEKRKLEEQKQIEKQMMEKSRLRQLKKQMVDNFVEPVISDSDALELRVRLPNGTILSRRFLSSNPVQVIYDFIDGSQEELEIDSYELIAYPRTALLEKSRPISIYNLGKKAVLTIKQK
eukprot:TRINITY_DN3433_c0_g1_i4.p1 TRINITY_DN3433_c0_g1~~TRINITY_DN3433_c0_g1_i4.p1  ORF type:complete len:204 (-),score=76.12 TRINITY_DN3433_c0_g1_i4:131-742(-)